MLNSTIYNNIYIYNIASVITLILYIYNIYIYIFDSMRIDDSFVFPTDLWTTPCSIQSSCRSNQPNHLLRSRIPRETTLMFLMLMPKWQRSMRRFKSSMVSW